ncbi:MAG: DUF2142 domain-containing protein [Clostridia bacterium]|nr:DUF2142 domain-containing protein [Clostridia bacterium]
MIKKMQKSDFIFLAAIIAALLLHLSGILTPLPYNDEALYPTVPLRFMNGDVMMQHEWHFTQFSSLFLYLPVMAWMNIKGSTEGMILFLRIVYLIIHTLAAFVIYKAFRRYKLWAVAAAVLFYTQTPYRMLAISYVSMVVLFLLFFSLCLYAIHEKEKKVLYIAAGICFGACCVCNPLWCFVYPLYIIACVAMRKKHRDSVTYNRFFAAKPAGLFSTGIGVMAAICIAYFFVAGGSFALIPEGIKNLFASTEYGSFVDKAMQTARVFSDISLKMPFMLPVFYGVIWFDKNRRKPNHRTVYLALAFAVSVAYTVGVVLDFTAQKENGFFLTLPLLIFSTVCYILTRKKNKAVFYCIWCPCVVGAFFQYLAANTLFTAMSIAFAGANVAGVFFVHDLFKEITSGQKEEKTDNKRSIAACRALICTVICLQFVFNCFSLLYDRVPDKDEYTSVKHGPLSDFYLNEVYYESYTNSLNDMDIIRSLANENEPVLILSRLGWMHLYIERPFASYSTCLMNLDTDMLGMYYNQYPEKIPAYIYVGYADRSYIPDRESALSKAEKLEEMFDCSREELSMGILLTVEQ